MEFFFFFVFLPHLLSFLSSPFIVSKYFDWVTVDLKLHYHVGSPFLILNCCVALFGQFRPRYAGKAGRHTVDKRQV